MKRGIAICPWCLEEQEVGIDSLCHDFLMIRSLYLTCTLCEKRFEAIVSGIEYHFRTVQVKEQEQQCQ